MQVPTKASTMAVLLALLFSSWSFSVELSNDVPSRDLDLWYSAPARRWTEALPIGNGRIGAMVFGGTQQARFQLNEDTLWTGAPHSYAHSGAAQYLPKLRSLLFAGKQKEAEQLATKHFMSVPMRQMSYQPLGDLTLEFSNHAEPEEYRRSLGLDTAIATTAYRINGARIVRESFVSYPDQALVVHLSADGPATLSFTAKLSSPQTEIKAEASDDHTMQIVGKVHDAKILDDIVESKMTFASHLRVLHTDGKCRIADGSLEVSGASEVTLVLTAATNYVNYRDLSANPIEKSHLALTRLEEKSYRDLREAHIADHQRLFQRVKIDLGSTHGEQLPTDERLNQDQQAPDPELAALLFNYGRYLMIASSRPGSQPANLQGIWNDQLQPPWGSKYTVNINTEMNYWLTGVGNLAECNEPLIHAITEVAASGRETAREHYDARGWVLHHNFDLWRGTAPINGSDHGIWPTGGAWLCQHLWWHYLYTEDKEFLRQTAYPLMKGASEFFADTLVVDPRDDQQWLISGPSNSPEQGGLVMGPTMDHQIIRNLLTNTINAAKQLGIDDEFRAELQTIVPRLAPNKVGRQGQLQEWLEDVDDPNNRHRHVSHLWGVFPGHEITQDTPRLFQAAKKSLEFRGDGGTGWALAWKINLWARLADSERAYQLLMNLLRLTDSPLTKNRGSGLYPNMFDAHPPFQIDGNFGATHGISQMLVQAHRKTDDGLMLIELLPALPTAYPEGSITGLRLPRGLEIDISWQNGQLTNVSLQSSNTITVCLVCHGQRAVVHLDAGETKQLNGIFP